MMPVAFKNSMRFFILLLLAEAVLFCLPYHVSAETESIPDPVRVVILRNSPPLQFYDNEESRPSGFAVDLFDRVAAESELRFSYVLADTWSEMINMILNNQADIVASLAISEERRKNLAFSEVIHSTPISMFIHSENTAVEGLSTGLRVGTTEGSISINFLNRQPEKVDLRLHKTIPEGVFALLAGRDDAFVAADWLVFRELRDANIEDRIKIVDKPLFSIKRAMAVQAEKLALLNRLNLGITAVINSPDYREIYVRWYGQAPTEWTVKRVLIMMSLLLAITVAILGSWRMLTARRLNQALRESEERFRSIFESAAAPMAIIAPNKTFLQVNPSACRLFGYTKEEFQSLNVDDIEPPSNLEKTNHQNEALKSDDRDFIEREKRYLCKDGSMVWGHSTIAAVRDSGGNLLHFVALTQNITKQKLAELELVKHKDHLEVMVAEKTQELQSAQDELLQQERLAALGKLTATVSHELRNPLGALTNGLYNIEAALDANDGQMARNALQLSERSVNRCVRIIDELLYYGRKDRLEQKPVAIDELINETLDEMKWPEGLELRRELKSDAVVSGDKERLRRVVLNLVINAQQALQESNQTDKLILVATRKADTTAEIMVEDNGPGIPEDLHEKIFEPLFSTKSFGVGLGMSVVKEVIQMHKGDVTLQSPGQHGCRFVVRIPLCKS